MTFKLGAATLAAAVLALGTSAALAQPKVLMLHQWAAGNDAASIAKLGEMFTAAGGQWEQTAIAGHTANTLAKLRADVVAGNAPAAVQLKGPEIGECEANRRCPGLPVVNEDVQILVRVPELDGGCGRVEGHVSGIGADRAAAGHRGQLGSVRRHRYALDRPVPAVEQEDVVLPVGVTGHQFGSTAGEDEVPPVAAEPGERGVVVALRTVESHRDALGGIGPAVADEDVAS